MGVDISRSPIIGAMTAFFRTKIRRCTRTAKQHYPYLRRQIRDLARLHRRISNAGEDLVLSRLSAGGKGAVADYILGLSESEAAPDLKLKDAGSKLYDAFPQR